ncbi:MAG: methyl-accepting chemotaxis protein [Methylibium sp.]|jgi:methyl-accepting chemotaxis protein|nr:methyl-accepting chemotaxis protein [Methylibium sp.]
MDAIKNLRVGTRLALGFGMLLALLIAMAVIGGLQTRTINNYARFYPENILPSLRVLYQLDQALSDSRRYESQLSLADDAGRKDLLARLDKARNAANEQLRAYEPLIADAQDRALWTKAKEQTAAYFALQDKVLAASQAAAADPSKLPEVAAIIFGEGRTAFSAMRETTAKWWDYNDKLAADTTAAASRSYDRVILVFVLVGIAALALGLLAAWTTTRSITLPVHKAGAAVRAVAGGDLTQRLTADSRDELGQLLLELDDMTQNLSRMVSSVRQGCDELNVAAAEIAQGNADLSARTENQASSLEETAASVEQMASQIKANADNARQADQLAHHASEVASAGGTAVGDVVATMEAISASSSKISDIIGTIDGIAFQTNILALNAAVEAARAGEQGRGFAVVAGEVRLLAQRSAEAAKEIKSLIGDSVGKVESGSAQVLSARETIVQMVNEVRKVTDLVGEITVSSREQSEGVTQINVAVSQLDQATQQNAALVEQTAAAAESMRQQTAKLSEAVAVFRVDGGLGASPRAASPKPAAHRSAAPAGAHRPAGSPKPAVQRPAALQQPPRRPVAAKPAQQVEAAPLPPASAPPAAQMPAPKLAAAASGAEGDWETF